MYFFCEKKMGGMRRLGGLGGIGDLRGLGRLGGLGGIGGGRIFCHVLKMVYSYFVSLIYVFHFLS